MRNEDIPVIRRIPTNREDAFAFAIEGHLNDAALENLYGLLDAAYEGFEEIDLLIRLTGYEGSIGVQPSQKACCPCAQNR